MKVISEPYKPYPRDYELLNELIRYSNDVIHGREIACQKHIWACQRFLRDLDKEGTEEFPFVFNEAKAIKFLNWMKLFKHRKGPLAGKRIDPHIIQKFVFGNIYGWVHKETGYRRFDKGYWQVAKKNAKSQSLACVGTHELAPFGEAASEVYCAATKRKQARIVWTEAESMLKNCKELKGKFEVKYGQIVHLKSESIMEALSKEDGKEGDGLNPQCFIVDEYHAHKTSEIYDTGESAMISRAQPLMMIITTAGPELNNPCYRVEYDLANKILDPNIDIEIENVFVMINELDKGDDVKNEINWLKSNPIAASYPVGIQNLRKKLKIALSQPEKMNGFLTKNMNVWVEQRENGYMDMAKWKRCSVDEIPEGFVLNDCYVGVDLSSKIDLTSVSFIFPQKNGMYFVISHSFMPENKFQEKLKTDIMPYDLWKEQGWLSTTPGDVVDYNFVEKYIIDMEAQNEWSVQEICYDPYNATQFANNMTDKGYTCVEIRQGHRTLGEPTKTYRDNVYENKIYHYHDPLLSFAFSNAVVKLDVNENIMLDKKMSRQRIDPAAASINAFVRAMVNPVGALHDVTDDYLDELGW